MSTNTVRKERREEQENTKWVTVLPMWTRVLLEVKGQRYIGQCHLPWLKTALMEVAVLACFNMIGVTGCPVCCTSRCGSSATLATTMAAGSSGGPGRSRSLQSTGTVYTTTPVRMGYSVMSLSATETQQQQQKGEITTEPQFLLWQVKTL